MNILQSLLLNVLLGSVATVIRRWPIERLNAWLVRFGVAFGPPGLTHFSVLTAKEQQTLLARVPVLQSNHTDWIPPFRWVPRTLTVWVGPRPTMASVLMGNPTPPLKPVPPPGEWYVLRGYLASTTLEGIHDRLGWRYDDVNDYYELSVSLKTVKR